MLQCHVHGLLGLRPGERNTRPLRDVSGPHTRHERSHLPTAIGQLGLGESHWTVAQPDKNVVWLNIYIMMVSVDVYKALVAWDGDVPVCTSPASWIVWSASRTFLATNLTSGLVSFEELDTAKRLSSRCSNTRAGGSAISSTNCRIDGWPWKRRSMSRSFCRRLGRAVFTIKSLEHRAPLDPIKDVHMQDKQ